MAKYLDKWRAALSTEVVELAAGPAEIRRAVRLVDVAATGAIPMTLIEDWASAGVKPASEQTQEERDNTTAGVNAVCVAAFVDPKVTLVATPDSIAADDIPWLDRVFVFNRVSAAAEALRPFRAEQGPDDNASGDSTDVPLPTE